MEFVLGGVAAIGAGFFTNPLDVIKTRLQLQGELQARGMYTVHYRGFFHAFYAVAKGDGILALQKGLVPALWYQLFLNGVRLGTYDFAEKRGWTTKKTGETSTVKCIAVGAWAGCTGAFTGSPFYLIFSQRPLLNTFASSVVGGVVITLCMTPFDVVMTRLYNQGTDAQGRGLLYKGVIDCFIKMSKTEGIQGFYKGFVPNYIRLGPHTILCFVFWDALRGVQNKFINRQNIKSRNIEVAKS